MAKDTTRHGGKAFRKHFVRKSMDNVRALEACFRNYGHVHGKMHWRRTLTRWRIDTIRENRYIFHGERQTVMTSAFHWITLTKHPPLFSLTHYLLPFTVVCELRLPQADKMRACVRVCVLFCMCLLHLRQRRRRQRWRHWGFAFLYLYYVFIDLNFARAGILPGCRCGMWLHERGLNCSRLYWNWFQDSFQFNYNWKLIGCTQHVIFCTSWCFAWHGSFQFSQNSQHRSFHIQNLINS